MGLAHIGKIVEIKPIEGKDKIVAATVVVGNAGKWQGVVQKDAFSIGSLCEVFLQDAIVPNTPEFAFMESRHYIVRMARFGGVPSECLITPLTVEGNVGDDITEIRGVKKYDKPIAASLTGTVLGNFPSFIPRTDEPNFQSVPEMVDWLKGKRFYSTVKADGSSGTAYKYEGHFGVCSRNLELKETEGNAMWQLARKYNLEALLPDGVAIQFETIGNGIQGNPMGIKGLDMRVFNLYDIVSHEYLEGSVVRDFCQKHNIPMVDIVDWDATFSFESDEAIRKYAEGLYPNGKQREGVVIRPMTESRIGNMRVSMKSINLMYKG